ncbi:MAG: hypothetical protein VR65_01090 [Desulfobulbaceae bacterium BRH_c16a]|nr:MAG: hypothetical protein VR65_01090 [Desulfobulbaceae bacterium BRH_c16a]
MRRVIHSIFLILLILIVYKTNVSAGVEQALPTVVSAPKTENDDPDNTKLTLESALHIALANNPELAASQWDVAAAKGRVGTAMATGRPTLAFEGGYQHHLDNQRLISARYNGEPGDFGDDIFRGNVIFKLPIYTGGRFTSELESAELLKAAEEHRLVQTREELIFNVSSTFHILLGQREVIRSLEFAVGAMESHLRQVQDLLAAQKAARVDLLRTEVRLANLRYNLVTEQNALSTQRRLLANLLGVTFDPEPIPPGEQPGEMVPGSSDPAELIVFALQTRGDFLAARTRLEAQSQRVEAAKSGSRPTVSLFGSYGLRADDAGDQDDIGSAGLLMTLPVFDGGLVDAKVETERAVLAASQDRLKKLELQIRREIEIALLDIRSSNERINAARQSLEQAGESLRIEQMKYSLSSGSILDVLDAQSALLQSETNYTRVRVDSRIAMARLKLATGEKEQ